jgi:hypothetical protein
MIFSLLTVIYYEVMFITTCDFPRIVSGTCWHPPLQVHSATPFLSPLRPSLIPVHTSCSANTDTTPVVAEHDVPPSFGPRFSGPTLLRVVVESTSMFL